MAYIAPFIDASGLHIPTYQDIETQLVEKAQLIFGADIYLESDSQDFQDIAARAQVIYDTLLTAQMVYNSRSPATATGAALDAVAALAGIVRKAASNSTASVTLTGTAYTLVQNGVVADINGNLWNLPSSVTIDAGGTVTVTATCQVEGAITALANQINIIMTPTLGWTSVNNSNAATPGQLVETDSTLRARYANSVANPSQGLTTGILGSVLAVPNVASAQLYENDTNSPLSTINGVANPGNYPAHSITIVVSGGANADIASAIAARKTPGCYTNGDQSVIVSDQFGVPTTIRFYRPTTITIDVAFTIKALNGYSSAIGDAAKLAVVNYINSLVAGQSVIISELWKAAMTVIATPTSPTFSLTALTAAIHGNSLGTADITVNFNQQAITLISSIALTVT